MNVRLTIAILICLACLRGGYAQDGQMGTEVHAARGFLLPHRQNMLHLPEGPAHFAELRLFKQTTPDAVWKGLYKKPQVGVSIRVFDLANHDLLGYGIGAAAYFSSPVIQSDRIKWYLEFGAGPGFVSKPFNIDDNYKNIAIGSYGNVFIMLGQRFTYRLSNRFDLALATSFNHFSNAAFALPNLGLNYPAISLGLSFRPELLETDSSDLIHPKAKVKSHWVFTGNWGIKQSPQPYRVKLPTFSHTTDRVIGLSRKSSIALGLDVFYNLSLFQYRLALGESIKPAENIQAGLHAGYGMHIDRMVVVIQMGGYALDSYKRDGFLYHRVGFRYFLSDHTGINLALKTHFFKADYFEFGFAYKL